MISSVMTEPLSTRLHAAGVLLADGAMGTNLFAMGLQTGDAPELWNVDHPERIRSLHRQFVDAGADIILTNSFGGTRYRLALHGADERVGELNRAAAVLARSEADDSSRPVLVAGSMGPTGEILEPNGPLSIDAARAAFAEQAEALVEGGADILWIETLSSSEEIVAALRATDGCGLPVVCTASIDTNGRTMMGLTAADIITASLSPALTIDAVGTNCGVGAAEVVAAVCNLTRAMAALDPPPDPAPAIVAKANCGIPEYVDGKIVYNGTPALMAQYAALAADAGARIIGGCCGTTPAHVAAMRAALDERRQTDTPAPAPAASLIVETLGEISQGALAQLAGDLSVAGGSASGRGSRPSRRRARPAPNG